MLFEFNKYKAVLFDLDGVIADSEPIRYLSYQQLFKLLFNVELPLVMPKELIGNCERDNIQYFLDIFQLSASIKDFQNRRQTILINDLKKYLRPAIGLYELLDQLYKNEILISLTTNSSKSYAKCFLEILNIESYFSVIITKEDVRHSKPFSDIYLKAVRELNLESFQCIAVEDSPKGILAAKRAGITCIAITTSFLDSELTNANFVINNLSQLTNLL
tara:strand:+ start:609 stop:1262 length:654 start_codon:yes stop_codon:yes gene_type:complete